MPGGADAAFWQSCEPCVRVRAKRLCVHNMDADHTTRFARVDFRNDDRVFGIKDEDRFLHVYVIGKTGTGKSSMIERDGAPGPGTREWLCPH